MKVTNSIMAFLFMLSVAVQFNDPDPLVWVLVYAAAAIACVLYAFQRLNWLVPAVIALVSSLWAVYLFPEMIGNINDSSLSDIFNFFNMKTLGTELIREIGGLLIIVVWMIVLAVAGRGEKHETGS